MKVALSKYQIIEIVLHLIFWVFIFSTVNVHWQENWFDPALRPNTPAPLSVLVFPILFYAHAYWAIPKYLVRKKWIRYGLSVLLIFVGSEMVRLAFYYLFLKEPLEIGFSGKDSFIFGTPSIATLSFALSLMYRLLVDRVFRDKHPGAVDKKTANKEATPSLLSSEEAQKLEEQLTHIMREKQLFLQDDLKLSTLADQLNITQKKLSTLLNQHMGTSFPDYVNGYRIRHFIRETEKGRLQQLSVSGVMKESGFSSKATFYRAFKKKLGCTPTEWLKVHH